MRRRSKPRKHPHSSTYDMSNKIKMIIQIRILYHFIFTCLRIAETCRRPSFLEAFLPQKLGTSTSHHSLARYLHVSACTPSSMSHAMPRHCMSFVGQICNDRKGGFVDSIQTSSASDSQSVTGCLLCPADMSCIQHL